ncbi:hypothetical protein ACFQRK_22590 [Parapedobacter sp. GCM10030251]|uniref:hypothetical protein n=1 Tax=Parapedobacter sp. GCM10030251 TaxID=3273419 RepID=UPI00360AB38A
MGTFLIFIPMLLYIGIPASREDNDAVVFRSPFILGPYATGAVQWTALDTYRLGKHNGLLETFIRGANCCIKGRR